MSAGGERLEGALGLLVGLGLLGAAWVQAEAPGPLPAAPVLGARLDAVIEASEEVDVSVPGPGERVDLRRLAFDAYDPPALRGGSETLGAAAFPESARVLDGRDLVLVGFPLVLDLEAGTVGELLLTRFPPGCCFGAVPVVDEWVRVELLEPLDADEVPEQAALRGRLEVGEVLDGDGAVDCLYRLVEARPASP